LSTKKQKTPDLVFAGFADKAQLKYPAWRYHEWYEPITVADTEEDDRAKEKGYKAAEYTVVGCRHLINWRFDLEDMSAKQLAQFAKDNFEIDLPIEAGKEKLFKCIYKLHMNDPRYNDDIVLMAHSIKMEYDQTIEAIKTLVKGTKPELVEEFWA
jgi:hypothetical protein